MSNTPLLLVIAVSAIVIVYVLWKLNCMGESLNDVNARLSKLALQQRLHAKQLTGVRALPSDGEGEIQSAESLDHSKSQSDDCLVPAEDENIENDVIDSQDNAVDPTIATAVIEVTSDEEDDEGSENEHTASFHGDAESPSVLDEADVRESLSEEEEAPPCEEEAPPREEEVPGHDTVTESSEHDRIVEVESAPPESPVQSPKKSRRRSRK